MSLGHSFGQYTTNGNAFNAGGGCYTMTIDVPWQTGSIFSNNSINLNNDFSLSGTLNFGDKDLQGADGFVFVFTNSNNALGSGGGNMGYEGISPAFGWELDDYFNGGYGDPPDDHMAITRDGEVIHFNPNNLEGPITLPNLEDGLPHCFEIDWDAGDQEFEASIDGNTIDYTGDIVNDIFGGNPVVYFGFTSATGSLSNLQEICFEAPDLEPMDDITVCPCETVQLQADPNGSAYDWESDPSLSDTDIGNPFVDPCETTTYNVTVDYNCFGSQEDEITVFVENIIDTTYSVSETCDPEEVGTEEELIINPDGCDTYHIEAIELYDHLPNDTIYYFFETCFPEDTGTVILYTDDIYDCELIEVEITTLFPHLPNDTMFVFLESCFPSDTGVFVTTSFDQFDCDVIIVETVTLYEHALFDTIYTYIETCNPQDTGYVIYSETDQFGCELTFAEITSLYPHLPNDTTFLFTESCFPEDTGTVTNSYNDLFGCDSVVIQTISLFDHLPNDTTYAFLETCNPLDTGIQIVNLLDQYGCDSVSVQEVYLYDPIPSDSIFIFSETCDSLETGVFINDYVNQYQCDSVVVHTIRLYEHLPNEIQYSYLETCNPLDTGILTTNLLDQYGCDSVVVEITSLYDPLPIDTTRIVYFTCFSSDTSTIISQYTNMYGCDSTVIETTVLYDNAPQDTTYIDIETCSELDTGVVVSNLFDVNTCDSVVVYKTVLYPHLPNDTTHLNYITCSVDESGVEVHNLTDLYGCDSIVVETISLSPSANGTMYLSAPEDILEGEHFTLTGITSLVESQVENTYWEGLNITNCNPCLSQEVQAAESGSYSLEIITNDGCVLYDEVYIEVIEQNSELHVPNVFSPNGDGVNDLFTIGSTGIDNLSVRIFDRWGNYVFSFNDVNGGWDGRFNGKASDVGVYAVFIQYVDQTTGETQQGLYDLTLVR